MNEDSPQQSGPAKPLSPVSVSKVASTRPWSYDTSIGLQNGAKIDPIPAPWGFNHAATTFVSNWWRDNFTDPVSCFTHDRAESLRTGKVYIPRDQKYRVVLNFEDARDSWASWPFEEMERYRAAIKDRFPYLTLSAYVAQGYNLLSDSSRAAISRIDMLRKFSEPFDEITPSLYFHEGDDLPVNWSKVRDQDLSACPQYRLMRVWERSIAPGKPLSPAVWWFVSHKGYKAVTRDQFWKLQVGAALSSAKLSSVILWGNVRDTAEQRIFDAAARPVIGA